MHINFQPPFKVMSKDPKKHSNKNLIILFGLRTERINLVYIILTMLYTSPVINPLLVQGDSKLHFYLILYIAQIFKQEFRANFPLETKELNAMSWRFVLLLIISLSELCGAEAWPQEVVTLATLYTLAVVTVTEKLSGLTLGQGRLLLLLQFWENLARPHRG